MPSIQPSRSWAAPSSPSLLRRCLKRSLGRGRQIDQLQFPAPGTTGSTFSHRVSGGVDFEQEIIYNGIPVPQSETEGYTTNYNPPFDLVQEYKVERSTFSAQFGLGQGALTYQMRSGTNRYHGNLFEINRNSFFDSVGFFNGPPWNSSNIKRQAPRRSRKQLRILGRRADPHPAPLRWPQQDLRLLRQEWYKQNTENTSPGTVPTAAEKAGDFSNYLGADCFRNANRRSHLRSSDRPAVPGQCIIPAGRFSPIAASILQYIPDPDNTGFRDRRPEQQQELCALYFSEHPARLGIHGRPNPHSHTEPALLPVAQHLSQPGL